MSRDATDIYYRRYAEDYRELQACRDIFPEPPRVYNHPITPQEHATWLEGRALCEKVGF